MGPGAGTFETGADGALSDGDLHARVDAQRAAALYGKGVSPYLSNVMIGAIEVVAVASVVPAARRYGWLALMSVVTLVRLGVWRFNRRHRERLSPHQWCVVFAIGGTVNGLCWGATAFFLWGPGAAHHALLGFVVGGMVAGSTAVVPAYLPAFYSFATASILPMAVRLLAAGGAVDLTMGVLLLVFGLNMTKLARYAGRWFVQNTELELRNAALVEHLSEARDHLERRVAERTAELEKTVAQLRDAELRTRDAVRVRNDFLAVAAHELRTPLATLELQVGRIDWHLSRPGAIERTELADSSQALRRQVRRLTGLVDTVLTASGLPGQGIVLAPVELDLAAVVRAVVADATAAPAARSTPVSVLAEESVTGLWDPVRLEQVVSNLVSNALKYGVGRPLRISVSAADGEAILQVHDEGPGIAPRHRERIFERFFRADVGGVAAGLGLGLAVVHEIVDAMKGAVTVESQPGSGTTFTVRLPRRASLIQSEL
jgi:signal transduction histidine kinase